MGTTQLQIYNGALRILGERRLKDLTTDNSPSKNILDDIWAEDTLGYCLEQGQWAFATRTQKLVYDSGITPSFGYQYAFPQPDDFVRPVMISDSEYFHEAMTQFVFENGYFLADITELYLRYVSSDALYGKNLGLMPFSYVKYVQSYMAFEASNRITGVKVDVEKLGDLMAQRLKDAQSIDGMNRPTQFMSKGSWNKARNGYYQNHYRDRRR